MGQIGPQIGQNLGLFQIRVQFILSSVQIKFQNILARWGKQKSAADFGPFESNINQSGAKSDMPADDVSVNISIY